MEAEVSELGDSSGFPSLQTGGGGSWQRALHPQMFQQPDSEQLMRDKLADAHDALDAGGLLTQEIDIAPASQSHGITDSRRFSHLPSSIVALVPCALQSLAAFFFLASPQASSRFRPFVATERFLCGGVRRRALRRPPAHTSNRAVGQPMLP